MRKIENTISFQHIFDRCSWKHLYYDKKNFNSIFNPHHVAIALENQTFVWYNNRKRFCFCCYICRELRLDLNVSHRVFEFLALSCHVKDKHWEELFLIWRGNVWWRNQLFEVVKLCSKRCCVTVNPRKLLLCKIGVIILNLRGYLLEFSITNMFVRLQRLQIDGLCSWLTALSVWKATIIQRGFSGDDFTDNRQVKFFVCGTGIESYWIIWYPTWMLAFDSVVLYNVHFSCTFGSTCGIYRDNFIKTSFPSGCLVPVVDAWTRRQFFHNYDRIQKCVSVELWMKMFLLRWAFEWYIVAELKNHYSDYFQQLKRLCQNLSTIIGSNPCFFENHLEIWEAQASLLLGQGERDSHFLALKVYILYCWKGASWHCLWAWSRLHQRKQCRQHFSPTCHRKINNFHKSVWTDPVFKCLSWSHQGCWG